MDKTGVSGTHAKSSGNTLLQVGASYIFRMSAIGLLLAAIALAGCSKPQAPKLDPHSVEAVLLELVDQARLLDEALARQDYNYLHDFGFRFKSLTQAFLGKLDEQQRPKMRTQCLELLDLASQLDRAAGGNRADATAATVQKLGEALKATERLYRETKTASASK